MTIEQQPNSQISANGHKGSDVVSQPNQLDEERAAIRSLMAKLPRDYADARNRLANLVHVFHEELAATFQPYLRAEVASLPNNTLDDKRTIAHWANGEVRHLGLGFRAPSGASARLVADYTKNGRAKHGRFRFDTGYQAGSHRREGVYLDLPPMDLMEEGPRQEPAAKWTDRISHDDAKPQR